MGRFSKNLIGYGARMFVSPAIEYTDDTTMTGFVNNAPEGEIGVFLEDGTVRTTALTAGLRFYIAQKKDGLITRTPVITFGDLYSKRRTAFDAPATQVTTVGYNGTSGDVAIDFTGASPTAGKEFALEVRDTSPGNQPFPIQEARTVVTSSSADEYTVIASIVSQLNADNDLAGYNSDRFVKAEILSNGTVTALGQTLTVVNGSRAATAGGNVSLAAGTLLSIAGTIYKVPVAVVTATAIVLDRPYQGTSATVASGTGPTQVGTMAYTSGTTLLGIRLTALLGEVVFTTTVKDGLALAPITAITAWKLGSGYATSILQMEKEALFFDGVGSTANAAFAADYGQPRTFTDLTLSYHLIFLDFAPVIIPSAALPHYKQEQIQRIIIASPTAGTTPDNEFQTIFGV